MTVLHIGPDPAYPGGMGSVMRLMVDEGYVEDSEILATCRLSSRRAELSACARVACRLLRSPKGTILHAHLSQRGSFVREGALLALARGLGLPTIVTVHGSEFAPFARAHPRLTAAVLRRANVIVYLANVVSPILEELAPLNHRELIPNPLPVDPESPPADTTAELAVFAGELGLRKGVDVLLQAWPSVSARCPEARCILVGPRTDLLIPATPGVEVKEPVDAAGMRGLLRRARVVVLPSRAEARPMILLEAIGARRPFVSTRVGDVPELAVGGNLLVSVGDADELADGIVRFLRDPAHARSVGDEAFAELNRVQGREILQSRWVAVYARASALSSGS